MIWIAIALLVLGLFLVTLAAVGIIIMPDFYSRVHMVGKADTLGSILVLTAVMILEGFNSTSLKVAMVVVFFFLANPASAHALGHAALRSGLAVWTRRRE